jgi:hypothetical protein
MMRDSKIKAGFALFLVLAFLANPILAGDWVPCFEKANHSCCPEEETVDAECHTDLPPDSDSESLNRDCEHCYSPQPATQPPEPILSLAPNKTADSSLAIPTFLSISSPVVHLPNYKLPSAHQDYYLKDLYILHSTLLL